LPRTALVADVVDAPAALAAAALGDWPRVFDERFSVDADTPAVEFAEDEAPAASPKPAKLDCCAAMTR
jgi:hypothetical protein